MQNRKVEFSDMRALLNEAKLLSLDWQPELAQASLVFDCRRRNTDGSELSDRSVEIRLNAVERIAAFFNPANIEVRPSTFKLESPISKADLKNWTITPSEAQLSVNSKSDLFHMTTSWRIDWIKGDALSGQKGKYALCLRFDQHYYGKDACEKSLFFDCNDIELMSSSIPLDLYEWGEQCDAWWRGWGSHWEDKESSDADNESPTLEEDTIIPAGEDPPPDTTYIPPSQPAFIVESDAPDELLKPIRDWHEGLLERDWQRVANAWPDYDQSATDRAERLQEIYMEHDFGRWAFVRQVDDWWQESNQACVIVRGIEHTMPDEEDPALNKETVISYALRKHDAGWAIWTFSQGWPQHGSAPTYDGEKPWLVGWKLTED